MHVYSKDDVARPIITTHGETIYEILGRVTGEKTDGHSVAHITLDAGKASLLHYHPVAEESYYILSGNAEVMVGNEIAQLGAGQVVLMPPTQKHKIKNVGQGTLSFLAICVPVGVE